MLVSFLILVVLVILFKLFHVFVFLRDPDRVIPTGNNLVSPADGVVVNVVETKQKTALTKGEFEVSLICTAILFLWVGKIHTSRWQ